jgi:hypothetical protein
LSDFAIDFFEHPPTPPPPETSARLQIQHLLTPRTEGSLMPSISSYHLVFLRLGRESLVRLGQRRIAKILESESGSPFVAVLQGRVVLKVRRLSSFLLATGLESSLTSVLVRIRSTQRHESKRGAIAAGDLDCEGVESRKDRVGFQLSFGCPNIGLGSLPGMSSV